MKSKITCRDPIPFRIKLFAWLNIGVQTVFPLSAAFTPVMAGAGSDKRFLEKAAETSLHTQAYTLSVGENTASVARKFNISPEELRRLNQLRTFAHGFDNLQPGDELDVPLAPLPEVLWSDVAVKPPAQHKPGDDERQQKIAGLASQAGGFLASNPNGDAASGMARGLVTGEASSQIQQWLSQFGNARVQLDADKNFSLKNSQLDLLVPLFEQKDRLIFTQSSLHRTDDRIQANLGVGSRWFADSWMVGGNTFLDYDLSRDHARAGMGVEYWRDFLKLGANSYLRLTSWKDSPDVEDYEERPANGWDIRGQAWLPALPQLGGKLIFEQYYGKQVALFGKDNRQSNPHAVTLGVNYTPFPLLTLNTEHRKGHSGKKDSRFGMDMNYQMGVPWQQQINPDAVAAMRSLAGSRYGFVERNNNIVLEYRKKEVIRLQTADLVTGYAGEQKSLGVVVNSKYGLERIDWSASSLLAAGGKIVKGGASDYTVVLPAYQSAQHGVNTYTISGVAVDKKGNVSSKADTQVTVTQAAIDMSKSLLTPSDFALPADGKSQQQLVLKVNDREGKPVDIADSEITIQRESKLRGTSSAAVTAFSRRAAGEYVATITAGTMPEVFTVTPSARNTRFASANVAMTADHATALIASLDVVVDNATADGKSENKIKLVVVDAENNPVPTQTVSLEASNEASIGDIAITDVKGEVVVPVTSGKAGEVKVTANINGKGESGVMLTFSPDKTTAEITKSNLTVLPENALADGKTRKTIRALVTDSHNNPVADAVVAISADNGATPAASSVTTDAQGFAVTTLTSTVAGLSRVTATVNNHPTVRETTFTGNSATALVTSVMPVETSGVADGKTAATFKAVVKDQNNNPLPGIPVDWQSDRDGSVVVISQSQTMTNEKGVAETTVSSTRAYDVVVTASTNASAKSAMPFAFVADNGNSIITQLASNRPTLTADGKESAGLTVKVADTHGNTLKGVKVALTNKEGAIIKPELLVTDAEGVAQATLTTRHAGVINITAKLDNGENAQLSLQAKADTQTAVVTLIPESQNTIAGGKAVTLTATVVDAHNNPVNGTSVAWRNDHNQLDASVSVTDENGKATVNLSGTQAVKTTVTAVLHNGKEGAAQVTFGPGAPDTEHSRLFVSPQSISADGNSIATATLALKDIWDNPVPQQGVAWTADEESIRFSASEVGDGVYKADVTGKKEGTWTLTATSGSATLLKPLGFLANENSALIDSVTVYGKDTAKADGLETITLRAQVKDTHGNTNMKGVAVGWNSPSGSLSAPLSKTDESGVAEIKLSSKQVAAIRVSAVLGGGQPVSADKDVTFTAGDISASQSSLSVTPANIVAAAETTTIRVTARDAEGNGLPGLEKKIALRYSTNLSMTEAVFKEMTTGVYEAQVTGNTAGTTQISAQVNNVAIGKKASLTLKANNASAIVKGEISVSPTSAIVSEMVTYRAVLTDINGNALGAGIPVTWSANEGSTLSAQVTNTDKAGVAEVTLTRVQAGTAEVSLILPSGSTPAPEVKFSANVADENNSELTLAPSVIVAGKESAVLTLILRDKNGNLLSGQTVKGTKGNSSVTISNARESSTQPGHYTLTINGKKTETANLSVEVNSTPFRQSKTLSVKGDTESWQISEVNPDIKSFVAGDGKGVTYRALVTDAHGNKLPNVVVSWQLSGEAESYSPTSRTNDSGIASTVVKSHTAGTLEMTAHLDEGESKPAATVTVKPGAVDTANSSFTADRKAIGSDGIEAVSLTVILKDSYMNAIPKQAVSIVGADKLQGFKLTAVSDKNDGSYQAQGTSTTKGQVTLNAKVGGVTVGPDVTITVGAMTPDLRFLNAQQKVTYTRTFNESQAVANMPEGVEQMWSSSDPSIAKVDGQGKVTLLKSGTAKISVYTPGNMQYNPALASYDLKIDKADPKLKAGDGNPIAATWADGKIYSIAPTFGNSDVQDSLDVSYKSKNTALVKVGTDGKLQAIKPGSTSLTVSTVETEQFIATSVDVPYVLSKATHDLSFDVAEVKTTDEEETFTVQQPVKPLPEDANITWSSSDNNVVNISNLGSVNGKAGKGRARLTLSVAANEYYNASSAYYDVLVYTRPAVNLGAINYISKGSTGSSGRWTPVFTDDNIIITWSADTSNDFSKPESVTVYLKDSNGNTLAEKTESSASGSKTTTITPKESFWGKAMHVELMAKGFGTLATSIVSDKIAVENLKPSALGTFEQSHVIKYVITSSGKFDDACQTSQFGRTHHVMLHPTTRFQMVSNKTLIMPLSMSHQVVNPTNQSREVDYGNQQTFRSDGQLTFTQVSHSYALKEQCWDNHYGEGRIQTTLKYASQTETIYKKFSWAGTGNWD